MRHPNAEQIQSHCEAALGPVLESLGLPSGGLRLDTHGWVNVCFIGQAFVVRFNARDPELPKCEREEFAMRVLADRGFPVPRVFGRINDPDISPFPVLVTQRMHGQNLEATWNDLSPKQQRGAAEQAGMWLARIHNQPLTRFGEVTRPQFDSLADCWREIADRRIAACEDFFDGQTLGRFRDAAGDAVGQLAPSPPRLVHRDYHLGNLLHSHGAVTALLDFEWCMAGAPIVDRVAWRDLDDPCAGAMEPFVAGYNAEFGEYEDAPRDVAFFAMCGALELCDVAYRFLSGTELADFRGRALEQLTRLEAEV